MIKKTCFIILGFIFSMILSSCDLDLNPTQIKKENIESFDRFFDDTQVKTLHIKITESKWQELDQAMLKYHQKFNNWKTDYMVEANLEYEDDFGSVYIDQIGLRTRGNMSRRRIQDDEGNLTMVNFKISFHEPYQEKYRKRTVFELEEIDLKYNRNEDDTYLTEKYAFDLFSDFGVYAAKTTLVKVMLSIGNETHYYGIYTAFEPIDDEFIKRRMSKEESQGNLYKTLWQNFGPANLGYPIPNRAIGIKNEAINYRPSYDLKTNKAAEDHRNLRSFIKDINEKTAAEFKIYIEDHFDVDRFLRYLAVGVLLGNPDDYRSMGNNYYLYQNSGNGKWTVIPYDYDHGLGQGWDGEGLFLDLSIGKDIYSWEKVDALILNNPHFPHVLVDKILSYEDYQIRYESYLKELISGPDARFSSDAFLSLYDSQYALYHNQLSGAILSIPFGLRNVTDYIDQKVSDINSQLIYYQENPSKRGT